MKSLVLLLPLVVLVGFIVVTGAAPDATCKEFVKNLTKKQLKGITVCSKTMKFKNPKDKAAKMNCILKCVLKKEGLLDSNGQFVKGAEFDTLIENFVPNNLKDDVLDKFVYCKDNSGSLNDKEKFCKSYDPLIKCMLDMIGTACK